MKDGALSGVRIADFSRVLAGPYCTMMLADLGADVIKVENPAGGDDTRQWGPPWLNGQAAYYLSLNRNKRSITLNFKHPRAQAIAKQLIAQADVMIENLKAGTMKQYGLDYEALCREFPGWCIAASRATVRPARTETGPAMT